MPITRTQDLLNSFATFEAPSILQNRYEYDGSGLATYAGYAVRGAQSSDDVWTVYKYTYVNSQVTLKQTGFGSWDNRADLVYA